MVKINIGENEIYTIEGNIAAGKTTLGISLAATGLAGFIPEPVSIWQNRYDENLLELFYSDKKRWAFTFQLAAFTTRAKTWADVMALLDHSKVFLDRSIYADRYIFAKSLHLEGAMTDTEYKIYTDMWDWMEFNWCVEPTKIIYVKTPPELCLERIDERNRGEEAGVPIEYLRDIHQMHEEWLSEKDNVITIDGSKPINVAPLLKKLKIK